MVMLQSGWRWGGRGDWPPLFFLVVIDPEVFVCSWCCGGEFLLDWWWWLELLVLRWWSCVVGFVFSLGKVFAFELLFCVKGLLC